MAVNLKSLIGKLNDTDTERAGSRGGPLPFAHALRHRNRALPDEAAGATDDDFARILSHFGVDPSRLAAELTRSLDKLKRGNARTPALSPTLLNMLTEAWTIGSIDFGAGQIRTGFTILALASNEELARLMREISREFQKIQADEPREGLCRHRGRLARGRHHGAAAEEPRRRREAARRRRQDAEPGSVHRRSHRERQGGQDRSGARPRFRDPADHRHPDAAAPEQPDPHGRGGRRQDGRGRRASRCASRKGDVPPPLRNVTLRTLDLALLQAGAGVKGEFENRLKGLIEEVKASPTPIILFIDEAHTMIGAGGQAGQGDAANLLKPALARGELRTIAATTWSEYKKYFEKDPALARRFQVVKVEEPTEEQCMVMLRGIGDAAREAPQACASWTRRWRRR